jgi:preprotein translocase subunit YajC
MVYLLAAADTPAASDGGVAWLKMLWPIAAIALIFWFLIFRPERKKQKARQELLSAIEKNDKVVTIGGLHGVVKSINDTEVTLLVDEKTGVTMKFNRSAIYAKITGDEKQGELEPPQK